MQPDQDKEEIRDRVCSIRQLPLCDRAMPNAGSADSEIIRPLRIIVVMSTNNSASSIADPRSR